MQYEAWSLLPNELAAQGVAGIGVGVFQELHRPWKWNDQGPSLGRKSLAAIRTIGFNLPDVLHTERSLDGTSKVVLAFDDARVEAIHMPRHVSEERVTLCISSQAGCAMGCAFCATAQLGLRRNLSAGEIVLQVLMLLRLFGPRHPSDLTLVLMGMGEPLHNLSSVARAVELLHHPSGLGISPRRITVSTVGLISELQQFSALATRPMLAISLNSARDETRRTIMPIARRHSLAELRQALEQYPLRAGERILIEYVLLPGINDTDGDAWALCEFARGFRHHINLIPFNAFPGSRFEPPTPDAVDDFARRILKCAPSVVTVRKSRGRDIQGACGQLIAVNPLSRA